MLIELAYGEGMRALDIHDRGFLGVLTAQPLPAAPDVSALLAEALDNPVGSPPLHAALKPGRPLLIVIGDITRQWARSDLYLPALVDYVNRLGVPDELITILSATGTHRTQTPAERGALIGPQLLPRVRFVEHDARDHDALVRVGVTSRGTPVVIDRLVAEAEQLILTGGVVQHFLAGYGGGRKAIIPGVASYETVQTNHKLSLAANPGGGLLPTIASLVADGNPVAEDMVEAAAMVNPCFGINLVVNERAEVARIIAGHWNESHRAACECVRQMVSCPVPRLADLVIVSDGGYPKDISMYQSIKTIDNAVRAARKGGVVLWLTRCNEGIGSADFLSALDEAETPEGAEEVIRRNFTIGGLVSYIIQKHARDYRVLVVTELDDYYSRRLGLRKVATPEEGLRLAYQQLGPSPSAYVMPRGSATVPVLAEGQA